MLLLALLSSLVDAPTAEHGLEGARGGRARREASEDVHRVAFRSRPLHVFSVASHVWLIAARRAPVASVSLTTDHASDSRIDGSSHIRL